MMNPVELGRIGENAVANLLRAEGWTINEQNTQGAGSTDIDASKDGKRILVQVKTSVAPNQPGTLDSQELRNIKSRAARTGATAYLGQVQLDPPRAPSIRMIPVQ